MGTTIGRKEIGRKIPVTIMCGGISNEREISIRSGKNVLKVLREAEVKTHLFIWDGRKESLEGISSPVIVLLHGKGGEDGTVQRYLEELGIKYTGSNAESCAVTFDKLKTKKAFSSLGLRTPKTYTEFPKFPCVVKPRYGGSSIGTKICFTKEEFKADANVVIEEYVDGREISVSIVEIDGIPTVLPILEIIPFHSFYDYVSKYSENGAKLIAPAALTNAERREIEESSLKIFSHFQMRDYARIDGIITKDGVYFLEVNAIPGMTEVSDLPACVKAGRFSMADILLGAVESSLRR